MHIPFRFAHTFFTKLKPKDGIDLIKKRISALVCAAVLLFCCGCSERNNDNYTVETVTVRYLNFKPEIAAVYQEITAAYKQETGRTVIVETAANNTYEQTLTSKMATSDAPTIFQINGPRGYANWERYCAKLNDTDLYKHLTDPSLALKVDNDVYGIPYVVEGYGIIYNNAIAERYFALENRNTNFTSMSEIDNFDKLKDLVEDMQSRKHDLGIQGVFACTSLKPGDDWRWTTHLANIPLYYEFKKNNIDLTGNDSSNITFEFADQYQNIFDLYLNNSTTDRKMLGTKIVDESMSEFALGQCAMVQNGNWAWNQISSVQGNTVSAEDVKFLPIYTGNSDDASQGICIGTESYLCINSRSSKTEQQAAEDFLYWLFSSATGKRYVKEKLNFIVPFDTFSAEDQPNDPLAKEVQRYMEHENTHIIPWQFTIFPSQTFKDDFGAALLQYAQGTKTWDDVKKTVVKRWKEESALLR